MFSRAMTESESALDPYTRIGIWWEQKRFYAYLAGLLVLLTMGFLWDRLVVTIPAGSNGVMYRRLGHGTVVDKIWGEGTYAVPPWDTLTVYETRLQEHTINFSTLTKDGLELSIIVSIRFYPLPANLGYLHRHLGPRYFERLIQPEVEAYLRRVVGDRTAEEVYSTEGSFLQDSSQVTFKVKDAMVPYVRVDEVLLRELQLPEVVREAINEKHRQEQLVLTYDYRLQTETKEAERKRIEASGIRDYNTIAGPITPALLRWRGIDATVALAASRNAKVVVVGGGPDGLPIILDTSSSQDGASPGGDGAGAALAAEDGAALAPTPVATGARPVLPPPRIDTAREGADAPRDSRDLDAPSGTPVGGATAGLQTP